MLATAAAITDPFEQSFFVMVQLPYLQPFDDVNKRVSRMAANIPFIRANLSPLSFTDVPRDLYTKRCSGCTSSTGSSCSGTCSYGPMNDRQRAMPPCGSRSASPILSGCATASAARRRRRSRARAHGQENGRRPHRGVGGEEFDEGDRENFARSRRASCWAFMRATSRAMRSGRRNSRLGRRTGARAARDVTASTHAYARSLPSAEACRRSTSGCRIARRRSGARHGRACRTACRGPRCCRSTRACEGTTPTTWEAPSLVQLWGPRYSAFVVARAGCPDLHASAGCQMRGSTRRVAEALRRSAGAAAGGHAHDPARGGAGAR